MVSLPGEVSYHHAGPGLLRSPGYWCRCLSQSRDDWATSRQR